MDYVVPRAADLPPMRATFAESVPCKTNLLGVKGCGELGTIGAALRYKRYPAEAIEAGWEGEVLVHVAIAGSGVADVSVKASSGQPLLDQQALAAFRAAAPLVPLPSRLRGQTFGVEVRAIYSLKD